MSPLLPPLSAHLLLTPRGLGAPVLSNPPFRNKARDLAAGSACGEPSPAFGFLVAASAHQGSCPWAALGFEHHNLYGYFAWLALALLGPAGRAARPRPA